MSARTQTKWRITGEEIGSCNCAWGCPCQFNARPTRGNCEALLAWQIRDGHYGDTRLDGVRFARIYWWPGAIHEGNGVRQMIIDDRALPEQRAALETFDSGKEGGAYFEIFAAVCPNRLESITAPITFEVDREARRASVHVPGIAEIAAQPIKNPVTGEEHRARIELPNGFEYRLAEIGNTVHFRVRSEGKLNFEHRNTYAQFNAFDWKNY